MASMRFPRQLITFLALYWLSRHPVPAIAPSASDSDSTPSDSGTAAAKAKLADYDCAPLGWVPDDSDVLDVCAAVNAVHDDRTDELAVILRNGAPVPLLVTSLRWLAYASCRSGHPALPAMWRDCSAAQQDWEGRA